MNRVKMKTINVMTHIPDGHEKDIPYVELMKVMEALVRGKFPKVGHVAFIIGTPNPDGINAIQVKAPLSKALADEFQDALKKKFKQSFEVSYGGEIRLLKNLDKIVNDPKGPFGTH